MAQAMSRTTATNIAIVPVITAHPRDSRRRADSSSEVTCASGACPSASRSSRFHRLLPTRAGVRQTPNAAANVAWRNAPSTGSSASEKTATVLPPVQDAET